MLHLNHNGEHRQLQRYLLPMTRRRTKRVSWLRLPSHTAPGRVLPAVTA